MYLYTLKVTSLLINYLFFILVLINIHDLLMHIIYLSEIYNCLYIFELLLQHVFLLIKQLYLLNTGGLLEKKLNKIVFEYTTRV